MTTPFRLFSLPFVPLKQVLDYFGSQGIIILSLCSQKSKSITISSRGLSKNVQLLLMHSDTAYLADENTTIWEARDIQAVRGSPLPTLSSGQFRGVQYKMDEELLVTFWEDELSGLIEIGSYAREIFNQDIYVSIQGKHADDRRRLTKWTVATQKSIEYFQYYDRHGKTLDEDLDYIFENLKCTGYLALSVTPSENYRPAKPHIFDLETLDIFNSFWIKQEDILAMNCKSVILRYSKLTSQDFNVFLKHWMTGGCSELENLCVFVYGSIDFEIVFDGVEFTKRGEDVERIYVDEEESHYTIRGGFDIKRPEDNITATIRDGFEDRTRFWMSVWPDYAGNSY